MELPPPIIDPETQPPEPAMSLTARLFNIFATPGEVFDNIKTRPVSTTNWLLPGLLLIIVSWLGAWAVFSQDSIQQQLREITDQAIEKQIQKAHLSEQQAEQARKVGAKYAGIGTTATAVLAPFLTGWVASFWWGLLLWLSAKALKADFPYMKGVEVTGLVGMITVLDAVLRTLLILTTGNIFASPSPAIFLNPFDPQNPVHGLLATFNIFDLWALAVLAIGLARLSGRGFGKAAAWVYGYWLAWVAFKAALGFGLHALSSRGAP